MVYPHGFRFEYRFSRSAAFTVILDRTGVVVSIEDLFAMANLLQTNDRA